MILKRFLTIALALGPMMTGSLSQAQSESNAQTAEQVERANLIRLKDEINALYAIIADAEYASRYVASRDSFDYQKLNTYLNLIITGIDQHLIIRSTAPGTDLRFKPLNKSN